MEVIVAYQPKGSSILFEQSVLSTVSFSNWSRNWITGEIKSNTYAPSDIIAKWKIKLKK